MIDQVAEIRPEQTRPKNRIGWVFRQIEDRGDECRRTRDPDEGDPVGPDIEDGDELVCRKERNAQYYVNRNIENQSQRFVLQSIDEKNGDRSGNIEKADNNYRVRIIQPVIDERGIVSGRIVRQIQIEIRIVSVRDIQRKNQDCKDLGDRIDQNDERNAEEFSLRVSDCHDFPSPSSGPAGKISG